MRIKTTLALRILLLSLGLSPAHAQDRAKKDIATIYAEGKVTGNEYVNLYFGVTLSSEGGAFTQGDFVSPAGTRARLIDLERNAARWDDRFEIAILADSRAANPLIRNPQQYVRAMRHQFERQGMITVRAESAVELSGVPFVRAILKMNESAAAHYRAIYSTFLKGYIVSLDVSAATPEKLDRVVASAVRFKTN